MLRLNGVRRVVRTPTSGVSSSGISVRAECGWLEEVPVGGLAHLSWWEGDDNHNMDAWKSEEAFGRFGEDRLRPAMAKVGVTAQPEVTFRPSRSVLAGGHHPDRHVTIRRARFRQQWTDERRSSETSRRR